MTAINPRQQALQTALAGLSEAELDALRVGAIPPGDSVPLDEQDIAWIEAQREAERQARATAKSRLS